MTPEQEALVEALKTVKQRGVVPDDTLDNEWAITTRLGDGTVRTSYCYGTADDAKACAVRRARDLRALDHADELVEVPS